MKYRLTTIFVLAMSFAVLAEAGQPGNDLESEISNKAPPEVERVWSDFLASVSRADLDGVLTVFADTPEFRYAHDEGALYDFASTKRILAEQFQTFKSAPHAPTETMTFVVGRDAVLYVWNGSAECVLADDSIVSFGPLTYFGLFRKFGDDWKIVFFQESLAPFIPVTSVAPGSGDK